MFTRTFWKATVERAGKSAAQALLGLWALDGFNVLHADFPLAGGVAAGAALLSVLTSIVSAGAGEPDSPSLVGGEQ
ncbi:holin [Micromonospora sp. WMMD710]|uniref:holin n=1 Tax=Micromonospora sp. WMMD710 TaxID=3016085 RepID=UPI00241781FF|nr:holin [Micromonospora sp. WMMD710]MDG4762373.1 holin [Micromonospora sp. WMMD710]MDG4762383.1 holin [Micromonospora sp. WMMD710]MDG4762419.1 holin [Micromonospora sp. WMMD710]MDG4762465.1 holin [Micromonospora sp. WMMD710]MDG4762500.1 holin [Micromonospora sp. WMMD710]